MLKLNQRGYTHENQALQYGTDHRYPERAEAGMSVKEFCRKYGVGDAQCRQAFARKLRAKSEKTL